MGSDIAKVGLLITGGVFGLGFGRQIVGPRIERAQFYSRRPRLGKFVRDSVIVAATIAGAAIGTAVGDKVFGNGGPSVNVSK
jgi:hypothetical protein